MMRLFSSVLIALALVYVAGADAQNLKAPNFELHSADGTAFVLSNYIGRVVVINFWATWCGPCRREIPDFIKAYNKYKPMGVEIIGISLDQDGWKKVTPFVKASKINYPIVLGDANVVRNFRGISTIPRTFIIDKDGNVTFQSEGMMNLEQLEAQLKPLL